MGSVYWVGQDGNVWLKDSAGTRKQGVPTFTRDDGFNVGPAQVSAKRIADPAPGGFANQVQGTSTSWSDTPSGGGSAGGSSTGSAQDVAFLNDQEAQLRSLLGRTDTALNQGLTRSEDEYNRQLGGANSQKEKQYQTFEDSRISQNKSKLNSFDTINKNAGNSYRSLAQIIGRASGTGSSAFRELLPDVIGKDTSSKRHDILDTSGSNLANIDRSQKQYDIDFQGVLEDLLRQRRDNEESLRSGVETQRQDLNQKLATVAGQRAQAQGGGYAAVKAAQTPFQQAIDNSRNTVESFFNQFRTPYVAKQAVAPTPQLADYTVDRSTINAQSGQTADPTNPYASLLRKRLQGSTF